MSNACMSYYARPYIHSPVANIYLFTFCIHTLHIYIKIVKKGITFNVTPFHNLEDLKYDIIFI